ncbi:Cyclin-D4-2 [Abeliophyllum distichum]|uniref:Cyclin-D4-2 n=1 Tax=Abeliophyllum distichum TaxID=126358 RepID=A0ABD1VQN6_9LAMI
MESPLYVPLLLDLQTLEPIFAFDPKSIQRMELRVMATLKWRLHSITPFDYLHYFISKISLSGFEFDPYTHILSTSSDLIVNTTHDFLEFSSSVIAVAAVNTAAGESVNSAIDTIPLPLKTETMQRQFYRQEIGSCCRLRL